MASGNNLYRIGLSCRPILHRQPKEQETMRQLRFGVIALIALLTTAALAADTYTIDPAHSSATFTVRHMMISTVPGRFSGISGTINYDEKDITKSSVEATIKTATVSTDNEYRDKDLKSANYFDVEKYPEITFKSTKVEKRGDQLVAIGDFTLHGVTKQIELPFEINKAITPRGAAIGATAELKLSRKDYGITSGAAVVGDEVKIALSVEAHPPKPTTPAK
jgi:polyisoprenoid-binding protein YceI